MAEKSVLDEFNWPKPHNKAEEFRQEFTKKIIATMERGEAFRQRPWTSPNIGLPYNTKTERRYNGVNIAYLAVAAMEKNYADPRRMTFKQAQGEGYSVNKGEHGTKIEFYTEYDPSGTKKGAEFLERKIQEMTEGGASQEDIEKMLEGQTVFIAKTYSVFNASQISGIEPLTIETPEQAEFRYHERAEAIIDNCGVPIQYGFKTAGYSYSRDVIQIPNREHFKTSEDFYSTTLHEIAHSTGHSSRMNRDGLGKSFGSPEYAMEELRAEMASAFVFQEIGMSLSPEDMEKHIEGHAAYTQNWLASLQNDYKEFYKAVRDAAKIADYTLAYEKTRGKAGDIQTPDTINPVIAAKSIMGETSLVTAAQANRTYSGEIIHAYSSHAVQRIGAGRGIIHNLGKIDNPEGFTELMGQKISISHDKERKGRVSIPSKDQVPDTEFSR
ncbi:hypothetical protein FACS1894167_12000 [Synergistales bacterium]|nr:hypothetical protein FACS1894167_12000 [Synergistales bacterium]